MLFSEVSERLVIFQYIYVNCALVLDKYKCDFLFTSLGMLLRWFNHLYDLEIVEEEAFMKWKEDITDSYPGKGKALFQVI